MKKLLFTVFVALSFVGCSNDDDNNTPNNQQTNPPQQLTPYFHPPTWIQGTWGYTNGTTTQKIFKFTTEDFIMLVSGSEQSMTNTINSMPNAGSTDELITNTEYKFTIKYNSTGVTQSFEFKKVSATQIQWRDGGSSTWNILVKL